MTLEKANVLLALQALMGGSYNRNGGKPILAEVPREHGQDAVDSLISTVELERIFGFQLETAFKS